MSLLQIRYFLVLAKHENLTRAAHELQLSPSALSKSICRLENDMGVKLFDRSDTGLKLNQSGLIAREAYSRIFGILDNMYREMEELSNHDRQRLNIIAGSNLTAASIITGFKKAHPDCVLNFRESTSLEIEGTDMILKYDYLIAGADFLADSALEHRIIGESLPVLMVPRGHELAALEAVTLADIARYPLISSPENTSWRKYVDSIFREKGLTTTTSATATYSMRAQMVASGLGISMASGNSVRLNPPGQAVEVLPIRDSFPGRRLYLYWNRSRPMTKIMEQFRTYAEEHPCIPE